MKGELDTQTVGIDSVRPHPKNVRQGDIGAISESLRAHGQYRAIVVQRSTGQILAGNHTWKAAKALGWSHISAHFIDCDDEQAMRILLADNRANDLATYDESALAAVLAELNATDLGLAGTLYDGDALDDLIADIGRDEQAVDAPDDAPAITKVGDIWLLGEHRLMCGDSSLTENLDRLMNGKHADLVWTDPPYGIAYVGGTSEQMTIDNDDLDIEQLTDLLRRAFTAAHSVCKEGAVWYVTAAQNRMMLAFAIPLVELDIWRQTLVWVKDSLVLSRQHYHWRHDWIMYGWKKGSKPQPPPDRSQDSVWEVPRPKANTLHPTMKPVELITRAIQNSSHTGDIVLDIFAGSGSTLIAAHLTNRTCYTIELDPHYCDIICARYQKQTGNLPRLEATGEQHDFLP